MRYHDGHCDDDCDECYGNVGDEWEDRSRTYKKPSNGQSSGNSDGCYVATAVYGSYDCPEVWTLRRFRDQYLRKTSLGRAFVKFYYAVSPSLVRRFGEASLFRRTVRKLLDSFVSKLHARGFEDGPYNDRK